MTAAVINMPEESDCAGWCENLYGWDVVTFSESSGDCTLSMNPYCSWLVRMALYLVSNSGVFVNLWPVICCGLF